MSHASVLGWTLLLRFVVLLIGEQVQEESPSPSSKSAAKEKHALQALAAMCDKEEEQEEAAAELEEEQQQAAEQQGEVKEHLREMSAACEMSNASDGLGFGGLVTQSQTKETGGRFF